MRNLILLAGTAALALAAPVAAEKGGKGGGHGHGGGKPAKVERGGGHGGGHGPRADKPRGAERQAVRAERRAVRAERQVVRAQRQAARAERGVERREVRGRDRFVDDRRGFRRGRGDRPDVRLVPAFRAQPSFVGYGHGCPPGLAKKGNGCLPPGQAKKLFGIGQRLDRAWFDGYRIPVAYSSFYYDTPDYYYRYDDDGYIYRADRGSDLISAIIPLLGGGFGVGQPLPAGYDVYNVPLQYRDTWYDNDDHLYRYGDNAIYRVDSDSGMIDGIVALLAGDLNVGQPLPAGYDAYNVPFDYRDRYYDDDEHLYRYADGNIYQVDAETQIVQAIVEMLA
ncbi:MAG TPA: hypothetical protein VEA60_12170 [Allosphingosinicella sp.]|nr:hypothetical protein [Allosphingosinicella sp.]